MTIQKDSRLTPQIETDGVNKKFYFDFPFFKDDDGSKGIEVRFYNTLDFDVVDQSLYTFVENPDNGGGYVEFAVAPEKGKLLAIAGATTIDQQLDITNHSRFNGKSIETQFDKIIAILQEWVVKFAEEERQRKSNDDDVRDYVESTLNELKVYADELFQGFEEWTKTNFPDFAKETYDEMFNEFYADWNKALNDLMLGTIYSTMVRDKTGKTMQEITDFIISYGACLPYDANKTDYADGAFLNENGVLKQWDATLKKTKGINFGQIEISSGGTGASTAEQARSNLGVLSSNESRELMFPLGYPIYHFGKRSTIPVGHLPYDGYTYKRADYPAFWAKIQSTFEVISDADWLADPKKRGCYSLGDGSTTFRMPDLNGVQTNSIKAVVLRGDGGGTVAGEAKTIGQMDTDAIRNIVGTGNGGQDIGDYSGAISKGVSIGTIGGTSSATSRFNFDASKVVPTAPENRMNSVYYILICRVGDTQTEVADITKHAVLTGGNTFSGSQKVTGGLEVAGDTMLNGAKYTRQSTWVNKSGMLFNTTYINSGSYEREIVFLSTIATSVLLTAKVTFTNLTTNVATVVYFGSSSNYSGGIYCGQNFIVPPNTSYKIEIVRSDALATSVGVTVQFWSERDYA